MFRTGTRIFSGENPSRQVAIDFTLPKKADELSLKIYDIEGKMVRELDVSKESQAGVHRVTWNLSKGGLKKGGKGFAGKKGGAGGKKGGGKGFAGKGKGGAFGGGSVGEGKYRIVLEADGQTYSRVVTIEGDPRFPEGNRVADEAEERRLLERFSQGREP
jgi:hypothetical protein